MSIEEQVMNLVENPILDLGITVKEIKYEKENNIYYLRIFIDREPFITIDDCVNVTNAINPLLDKSDFIDNSYMLDVSSIEKGGQYE